MKKYMAFILAGTIMLGSCKKETALTPSAPEAQYAFPQGNAPYDQRIKQFYDKYGCFILYKFSSRDFRWNYTANLSFVAENGNPDFIGQSLDTLDRLLFRFYSESFLQRALPHKILLASAIHPVNVDTLPDLINTTNSLTHFAFGLTDSRLLTLNAAQLKALRGDLHHSFWLSALQTGKLPVPPDFAAATNYQFVYPWTMKMYGILDLSSVTAVDDLGDYIKLITSNSKDYLDNNVFTPSNDPFGTYKAKYQMVVDYYNSNYQLDLQAIGNLP